jgi:hypothetical protein
VLSSVHASFPKKSGCFLTKRIPSDRTAAELSLIAFASFSRKF